MVEAVDDSSSVLHSFVSFSSADLLLFCFETRSTVITGGKDEAECKIESYQSALYKLLDHIIKA